jgi:hypothetical protein
LNEVAIGLRRDKVAEVLTGGMISFYPRRYIGEIEGEHEKIVENVWSRDLKAHKSEIRISKYETGISSLYVRNYNFIRINSPPSSFFAISRYRQRRL